MQGITQAGYFPGIITYFSLWYRKRDQIMRIGILFGAAILSSALDSILVFTPHLIRIRMLVINLGIWFCTYGWYPWSEQLAMDVST